MLKFMSERPNLTFVKWPVAVLLLLIVAAWSYQCYLWPYFITDHQLVKIVLKPHWWAKAEQGLRVEVVKSEAAKQQGLSNRPSLISQDGQSIDGMLFVYAGFSKHSYHPVPDRLADQKPRSVTSN